MSSLFFTTVGFKHHLLLPQPKFFFSFFYRRGIVYMHALFALQIARLMSRDFTVSLFLNYTIPIHVLRPRIVSSVLVTYQFIVLRTISCFPYLMTSLGVLVSYQFMSYGHCPFSPYPTVSSASSIQPQSLQDMAYKNLKMDSYFSYDLLTILIQNL